MDTPQVPVMPKKACHIQLMFAINDNKEALVVKDVIDKVVENIKDKRYTFQIVET